MITPPRRKREKRSPAASNEWENWPAGPALGAEAAILMEAETGAVLYEKNIHEKLYPASITKILTALIVMEQCSLDETVTYSYEAVNSIDWQTDSNIGIKAGRTDHRRAVSLRPSRGIRQ